MLNSNHLKIIAIICMIIDHIGYFFSNNMDYNLYILCRCIGRIAMPLFVFLLVEGFFYTKSLKKYILRIFIVAVITQIIIVLFNYIDINYFSDKVANLKYLNILFSFCLILIILRVVDKSFIQNKKIDIIVRILLLILVVLVYLFIDIDYGIYGALIALTFYILKKFENKVELFIKFLAQAGLIAIFSPLSLNSLLGLAVVFCNIFILLYNNQKGKKSKIVSVIFYSIFPIQYIIMYVIKFLV